MCLLQYVYITNPFWLSEQTRLQWCLYKKKKKTFINLPARFIRAHISLIFFDWKIVYITKNTDFVLIKSMLDLFKCFVYTCIWWALLYKYYTNTKWYLHGTGRYCEHGGSFHLPSDTDQLVRMVSHASFVVMILFFFNNFFFFWFLMI